MGVGVVVVVEFEGPEAPRSVAQKAAEVRAGPVEPAGRAEPEALGQPTAWSAPETRALRASAPWVRRGC